MERLTNSGFPHESWEEYAEHSLTHDNLEETVPYEIRKDGDCYYVVNSETGEVKAEHEPPNAKEKAERQVRLLDGIEHGMKADNG